MMTPISRHVILAAVIIVLFLSGPVSAAQSLVSESFTPNPPLVAGSSQHAVIQYAITSGTTFPKNHELQMQTDLQHAQWTLQVILDGNNAAKQTVSGSTAFLNGELLSYSVNHDVRFTVTIDGEVPEAASGTVIVLDLVEIDNTDSIVPGSESVISQPVAEAGAPRGSSIPCRSYPDTPDGHYHTLRKEPGVLVRAVRCRYLSCTLSLRIAPQALPAENLLKNRPFFTGPRAIFISYRSQRRYYV